MRDQRDEAERITDELFAAIERIGHVHPCSTRRSPTAPTKRTSSTRAA
ncbi:hypothetical protein [Streptomyces sp. TRM72054]|nr:hypothetical protein [Streptomyces sp. TRM72054]